MQVNKMTDVIYFVFDDQANIVLHYAKPVIVLPPFCSIFAC